MPIQTLPEKQIFIFVRDFCCRRQRIFAVIAGLLLSFFSLLLVNRKYLPFFVLCKNVRMVMVFFALDMNTFSIKIKSIRSFLDANLNLIAHFGEE